MGEVTFLSARAVGMQAVCSTCVVQTHPTGGMANKFDSGVFQLFCECSFKSCEWVWREKGSNAI